MLTFAYSAQSINTINHTVGSADARRSVFNTALKLNVLLSICVSAWQSGFQRPPGDEANPSFWPQGLQYVNGRDASLPCIGPAIQVFADFDVRSSVAFTRTPARRFRVLVTADFAAREPPPLQIGTQTQTISVLLTAFAPKGNQGGIDLVTRVILIGSVFPLRLQHDGHRCVLLPVCRPSTEA